MKESYHYVTLLYFNRIIYTSKGDDTMNIFSV